MSSDQYVIEIPGDFLVRALTETALAAFLTFWCFRSRRGGGWAMVGVMSALCWTAVTAVQFAAYLSAPEGRARPVLMVHGARRRA